MELVRDRLCFQHHLLFLAQFLSMPTQFAPRHRIERQHRQGSYKNCSSVPRFQFLTVPSSDSGTTRLEEGSNVAVETMLWCLDRSCLSTPVSNSHMRHWRPAPPNVRSSPSGENKTNVTIGL